MTTHRTWPTPRETLSSLQRVWSLTDSTSIQSVVLAVFAPDALYLSQRQPIRGAQGIAHKYAAVRATLHYQMYIVGDIVIQGSTAQYDWELRNAQGHREIYGKHECTFDQFGRIRTMLQTDNLGTIGPDRSPL